MEIIETKINNNDYCKSIPIACPVCKAQNRIKIPERLIENAKQITTVSISKNIICKHHFQCFIDKNFAVRGYQTVDYQIEKNENFEIEKGNDDKKLFQIIECNHNELKLKNEKSKNHQNNSINISQNMSLEEIYEEFWEFIDDKNEEFSVLIKKDPRRKTLSHQIPE